MSNTKMSNTQELWPFVFVLSALVLGSPSAQANTVHPQAVDLDIVSNQTSLAVVLRLDAGGDAHGMRSVEIPVLGPDDRERAKKDCGSYAYGVWTGTVVRVIYSRPGAQYGPKGEPHGELDVLVGVGDRLVVYPGNTPALIRLTRRSCLEGVSKSPIFPSIRDGAETRGGAELIALLRWEAPYGWIEAIAGSWLPLSREEELSKTLVSLHGSDDTAAQTGGGRPIAEDLLCLTDADCTMGVHICHACPLCDDTPRVPLHVTAARRLAHACDEWRTTKRAKCAPCRPPAPNAAPPVKPVCRAMRCLLP